MVWRQDELCKDQSASDVSVAATAGGNDWATSKSLEGPKGFSFFRIQNIVFLKPNWSLLDHFWRLWYDCWTTICVCLSIFWSPSWDRFAPSHLRVRLRLLILGPFWSHQPLTKNCSSTKTSCVYMWIISWYVKGMAFPSRFSNVFFFSDRVFVVLDLPPQHNRKKRVLRQECVLSRLEQDQVALVRRRSGGGAVFQDPGCALVALVVQGTCGVWLKYVLQRLEATILLRSFEPFWGYFFKNCLWFLGELWRCDGNLWLTTRIFSYRTWIEQWCTWSTVIFDEQINLREWTLVKGSSGWDRTNVANLQ